MAMEGLVINETTASRLSALAAAREHPLELAEVGNLDPETLRAYLEEIGETEDPEARILLCAAKFWRQTDNWVQSAIKAAEKIAAPWEHKGEDAEQQRTEEMGWQPHYSQLVRDAAYLSWDAIAANPPLQQQIVDSCFSIIEINNYLLKAIDNYFNQLITLAFRLAGMPEGFRDSVATILGAFSPTTYFAQMEQLNRIMSSKFSEDTLHVWRMNAWISAGNHILHIMQDAVSTAESAAQAASDLTETFRSFSPEAYHQAIDKRANRIWQEAGKPFGEELKHWFQAEDAMLGRIT